MGRVEFTTENKGNVVNYDYPKLKLKNNERARIIIIEDPVMEYVHTLRKPVIENGKPVIIMSTNERTGVTTPEFKKDFVGNPICLGDAGIVAEKGFDVDHCPACKLAKEHPDMAEPAKRRFAMHVVRYKTKSGSFNIAAPFGVELVVWSFTDMVFNKIVDFKEEWGDLRKIDFLLGPCTNETFQKFDIAPGSEAAWLKNDEHKKLVAETFKEQQIPDLTIAVGRQKQAAWVKQDVETILEAWRQAHAAEGKSSGSTSTLGEDLNGLLGGATPAADAPETDSEGWVVDPTADAEVSSLTAESKAAAEAPAADGDDMFGDLLASTVGAAEETTTDDAPEAQEAPKETVSVGAVDNFDDLLGL